MFQKMKTFFGFAVENFGPLILFACVNHFWGLKPAIGVAILSSFVEIVRKFYRKKPISVLFKFTSAMTVIFGAINLYAQHSFLFQYEATVTNLLTAAFFAASTFGEKAVLEEFYAKR